MILLDWLRPSRAKSRCKRRRSLSVRLLAEPLASRIVPTLYTWNNASGGSWGTAGNWTPNGLPGSNDDVEIPALASNLVITHSAGADTVKSVTLDANGSGTTNLQLTG